MDFLRLVPFFLTTLVIFTVLDIYFLIAWTKFIKQHKLKPVLYYMFWVIGAAMFLVSVLFLYLISRKSVPPNFDKYLNVAAAIWYLPKLVIVPYLFVRDFFTLIVNKFNTEKKKNFEQKRDTKIEEISDQEGRRKFIQAAGWTLAAVPFVLVTDGLLRTTYNFKIYKEDIFLPNLPKGLDGLKIVQLSDIHAGSFFSDEPMQEVRWIVNNLRPDFIFITGDYVNFNPEEFPLIAGQISRLKSNLGVYGCMGNHDHYMTPENHRQLFKMVENAGVEMLNNTSKTLEINGEILQLAGSDNINLRQKFGDLNETLKTVSSAYPTVLLCHDPTNWDKFIKEKMPVDLMLSGHTHGGQIGFEMFGADLTPARLVYKQWAGLYTEKDQHLYVNRGIGTVGAPLRVGIAPEITLLTLRTFDNRA